MYSLHRLIRADTFFSEIENRRLVENDVIVKFSKHQQHKL